MQKNIQQLTLERNQMMLAIKSKDADRRIAQDKVNKDFEAKLLAVVQKAEASANKDVAASLKQLAAEVVQFGQALGQYQDGLDDIAGLMSEQQQSDDATAQNQISMDPASLFAAVQPKAPKGRMNAR
jgi:predicted membrane-bound mannosyltransferase